MNFQNFGIKIGFPPGSPAKYKVVKFQDYNISVKEAINQITQKHNIPKPELYVLQITFVNEQQQKKFKWMDESAKLSTYPLGTNDVIIELKKRYQLIKIFDGKKLSNVIVDVTKPLCDLILYLSCKFKLKSSNLSNYKLYCSQQELNLEQSIKQLNIDITIPLILRDKDDIGQSIESLSQFVMTLDREDEEIGNLNQLSLMVPAKSIMGILKEGYLKKQNRKKTWNTRYFILTDKYLYYYKTPHSSVASGIISYREHIIRLQGSRKDSKIELIPKSKILTSASTHTHPGAYVIKFESEFEMNSWLLPPFSLDTSSTSSGASLAISSGNPSGGSLSSSGHIPPMNASGNSGFNRSARSKTMPAAVFGIPLDRVPIGSDGIPQIIKQTIDYLESKAMDTQGIFRLSGSVVTIDAWKAKYDRAEKVDLSPEQDPHAIAGLLKGFLRDLPDPILTYDKYNAFIQAQLIEEQPNRLKVIKHLIKSLPIVNQLVLSHLLQFLQRVATHSQQNKMQVHNLSTVFGPNLIKERPKENFNDNVQALVEDTPIINALTLSLIRDYAYIFQDKEIPEIKVLARTLYDYQGDPEQVQDENDRDLIFPKGVSIKVTNQGSDGWWTGEYQGRTGKFPATYVEILPHSPSTLMRQKSNTNLSKKKKFMMEMDNTKSKVQDLENNAQQLRDTKAKIQKQIQDLQAERLQLLHDPTITNLISQIQSSKQKPDLAIIPKNIELLQSKYEEYKKSHEDLQQVNTTIKEEYDQFLQNPKKKSLDSKEKDQLILKIENITTNVDKYQNIRQKSINSKRIINDDLKEIKQFFSLDQLKNSV
ncbi:pleckstrin (PH) domain-containing protein [Tieghemostelium lacteum]|uniref:Pleckstrin (PH) domain-containing protein n=1 Tax=Tieghemostelium lacteum TaxID=361077 RepID=A0A151Z3X9_TIELA|nr:pleckstrin (PH) domain-containing protein [Tieghemostelium lacteum]|eukprot:KYQ88670.1 pleckstrin (PH) domain-containing protein [Tieghemostelium lacteum]